MYSTSLYKRLANFLCGRVKNECLHIFCYFQTDKCEDGAALLAAKNIVLDGSKCDMMNCAL